MNADRPGPPMGQGPRPGPGLVAVDDPGAQPTRPWCYFQCEAQPFAVGLEAARTNGALVSARKGISAFTIEVAGKAVHAGVRQPPDGQRGQQRSRHSAC